MTKVSQNGPLLLAFSYLMYSFGYILIKKASELTGSSTEVLFAGNALQATLLAALVIQQRKLGTLWNNLNQLLVLSSFGGCAQYFYQSGVSISNPGNCTLIQASIPFVGAPVGWLLMKERIPKAFFPCVFVGFLGIVTVIGLQPVHTSEALGYVYTMIGLLLTTAWMCYQRNFNLDPFCAAFFSRLCTASIAGSQVSPYQLTTLDLPATALILVFASCFLGASVVSTYAISITPVSMTTVMSNVTPCFTYILQTVFLGTPIALKDILGISVTLSAMMVYAWVRPRESKGEQKNVLCSAEWSTEDPECQPLIDRQSSCESFGSISDSNSSAIGSSSPASSSFFSRIRGFAG